MTDLNKVMLVGRLVRDIELRYTASGTAVGNISLAVNQSRKVGNEWQNEVSFFDCRLWCKTAESLQQYLTKGKQIAIEGSLKQERWEKDGKTQSRIIIDVQFVQLSGGNERASGNSGGVLGNYNAADEEAIPF
ncbi:single-stranded DNA-binding protein [Treponema phagedenis]|uniref:single-stranded DNA-binding protein n=1 Tax=Treponema phagedenis TaxID=162 RepID=UPI0011EDCDC0|nr:single-stranded DNA-binding protein [Treponema phagedenis]TYT77796.1 single-stranded DNA-binding protein [Treponema phagedenis]